MICNSTRMPVCIALGLLATSSGAVGQSPDTPMTRLRPIGAPSAVDQYLQSDAAARDRETAFQQTARPVGTAVSQAGGSYDSGVRQTVMMQQFDAPALPGSMQVPGSFNPPPTTAFPGAAPPPSGTARPVPNASPRGLPTSPGGLSPIPMGGLSPVPMSQVPLGQSVLVPGSGDLAPVAAPQLGGGFATIDNCCCVSAPSSYIAATGWGECAPVSYETPQAYIAPPTQIAAPAILPTGVTPGIGVPCGPLISFGQNANPVVVGQGIVGQPVAYVPGQRIRNWIRYISP